jgi:hypothetical protein
MGAIDPLIEALQNKKIVTLNYVKSTTGESVIHTGGIQEIGVNQAGAQVLWLWDTQLNDHIRQFLLSNIDNYQVLDEDYAPVNGWPLKLNGEIIGY